MEHPSPSRARRWRDTGALAAIALFAAALYWPATRCGLVSDGWALLYIGSRPWRQALTTRLSYHFIPGTHLLNVVQWRVLGLHDAWYQAVNLLGLALVAAALYLLGRRLFGRADLALLAALIFLANSSYYEVPMWTGVGNFQSLAALLYLLGVGAAIEAGRSPRPLGWSLAFAVCGLAAFFTYEPAFSLLPAGVLAAALLAPAEDERERGWRALWRRVRTPGAAATAAVAVALVVKLRLAAAGDQPLLLPHSLSDAAVRVLFMVRGVIGIFTLRAHGTVVQRILQAGTPLDFGQPAFYALLVVWLAVFAAIAGALVRWGTPAIRFLTLWFAVHFALLSIAVTPQSRHYYLAALPAALLSAALICGAARRLVPALARRPEQSVAAPAAVALVALVLLVPGAKGDLDRAAGLFAQATAATREIRALAQARLAEQPPLRSVNVVNLPAAVAGDGVSAYFFVNGMHDMIELATAGSVPRDQVHLLQTLDAQARPGQFANGSRHATAAEVYAAVNDLSSLTLLFDQPTRSVRRLRPISWVLPAAYTAQSAPFLPWQNPVDPYLAVGKDAPLELLLPASDSPSWVAVRFLRTAGDDLQLASGARQIVIPPRAVAVPYWATATFANPPSPTPVALRVTTSTSGRIAGVWTFTPPTSYTPASGPFLTWQQWDQVFASVDETVELPLRLPAGAASGLLRFSYQREEGRDVAVAVDGEPPRLLSAVEGTQPWIEATLPLPATGDDGVVSLRIGPAGTKPARLRAIEVVTAAPAAGDQPPPR